MTADSSVFERNGRVGDFSEDVGADFLSCLNRATLKDAFAVERSSLDSGISVPECQYRYRSQGVFDVSSFGGNFDMYMKSLPNIARNYAKHCMNHFEKEISPADDLQLVVRLPPHLNESSRKVDKLTTSHRKKIEVARFHDVFNDPVSDFLDIAWTDILNMSWSVSVRQSASEEVAFKTCLLHLVAFDGSIRANDAVTAGLRKKSTGEWLGFIAYHFVGHVGTPTDVGIGGSIAQGLAVLSHPDDGSMKRKTNLWFLLFQQFLVNHIITVWGDNTDMVDLRGIDMVLSPLNTRCLADQKVRLFVPVVQQIGRMIRIQEDEERGNLLKSMLRHIQSTSSSTTCSQGFQLNTRGDWLNILNLYSDHENLRTIGVPKDGTLIQVFCEDVEIPMDCLQRNCKCMDDAHTISALMLQMGLTKHADDASWYFIYGVRNCDSSIFSKCHVDPLVLECFKSHSAFFIRVNVANNFLMSKIQSNIE